MRPEEQARSLWERPEPPAKATPTPLSRPAIVDAAIRLADRDGLDAVSIRHVASELGAGPMRLYGFVRSKEELVDLMVDQVYGEVHRELERAAPDHPGPAGRDGGWRAEVHRVAAAFRAAASRHGWIVDVLGGRPHLGPHALAVLEATAAALSRAPEPFDPPTLLSALGTVNAYVFGAIRADVVEARSAGQSGAPAVADDVDAYLERVLASGRHPTLRQLVAPFARLDPEEDFAWGLDAVLDGIAQRAG